MSSINEEIAVAIINGEYDDDAPVKLVNYLNQWGGATIAAVFAGNDRMRYEKSPACHQVETLWENGKLTWFGVGFFNEYLASGKISEDKKPADHKKKD